jgi:hypothetical protein
MSGRQQVEPTDEWGELKLRLEWPEQVEYELIRPPLLSDVSVAERSRQTGNIGDDGPPQDHQLQELRDARSVRARGSRGA